MLSPRLGVFFVCLVAVCSGVFPSRRERLGPLMSRPQRSGMFLSWVLPLVPPCPLAGNTEQLREVRSSHSAVSP